MRDGARVVSLYSFKGGAGRTLCTANLAGILAREIGATPESPILLIDMDLDSAGLTILLDQSKKYEVSVGGGGQTPISAAKIVTGEVDLRITEEYEQFFSGGLIDVSLAVAAPPGTVLFLGTEVIGREETVRARGTALALMRDLVLDCWEHGISTIVMDSASGRQETAHLCHMISDVIVYCCRLTHQFLTGTESHLRSFVGKCAEQREDDDQPAIILLPVAVPEVTSNTWEGRKNFALGRLGTLCSLGANTTLAGEVGEVESFKWQESILRAQKPATELTDDERQAVEAYTSLARSIIQIKS